MVVYGTSTTFELFWSQQSINSPCTGYPITFDFGYCELDIQKVQENVTGSVYIQQTIRHDEILYDHKESGKFSIEVPRGENEYVGMFIFDIPGSSFKISYQMTYMYTDYSVNGITLNDIQVENC